MKAPSRVPTTLAVGFLALDAALLLYGGVTWRRPVLTGAGLACAAAAAVIVALWRRYRHAIAEVDAARREMQREVEFIRELLQSHHANN